MAGRKKAATKDTGTETEGSREEAETRVSTFFKPRFL